MYSNCKTMQQELLYCVIVQNLIIKSHPESSCSRFQTFLIMTPDICSQDQAQKLVLVFSSIPFCG